MAIEAGRTRAGKKFKGFPKDGLKEKRLEGKTHVSPCFPVKVTAEEICMLAHAWSNLPVPCPILQSIHMDPSTQLDIWPSYQDWPKSKCISPTSLLEQFILCSQKLLFSLPPGETALI